MDQTLAKSAEQKLRKKKIKKRFCSPSKIFEKISWPNNIFAKDFPAHVKIIWYLLQNT